MLTVRITGVQPGEDGDARVVDATYEGSWAILACGTTREHDDGRELVSGQTFMDGEMGRNELVLLMNGLIDAAGPEMVAKAFAKAMARQYEIVKEEDPC